MEDLVELVKILGPTLGGVVVVSVIWARVVSKFADALQANTAVLHELKGKIGSE